MTVFGKIAAVLLVFAVTAAPISSAFAAPRTIASLGVYLHNDNYEPTSDAERARMTTIEKQLQAALEGTGKFKNMPMTADVQADITKGQQVAECGGCELDYGKRLGAETIAWVRVQRISNLIMNPNVYIADVATGQMLFQHSVDMRGNTDESWTRSMAYLIKNYLLPAIDRTTTTQPAG